MKSSLSQWSIRPSGIVKSEKNPKISDGDPLGCVDSVGAGDVVGAWEIDGDLESDGKRLGSWDALGLADGDFEGA